jgi:hypothetical protein
VLDNIVTESSYWFQKCERNSDPDFVSCFAQKLWLDYYKLHPTSGADEVNGQSLQLVTAVHDEFDCLTFCEQHS